MWLLMLVGLLLQDAPTTDAGEPAQPVFAQAVEDFAAGRFAEAARGFDRVAELRPELAPELWQRGIALFYAGRYADCRAQFESHRTVNPADVENAAWHFLCVAHLESPAAARAALLPVGSDPRRPMAEVYRMLQGTMSPTEVLSSTGADAAARFYGELYVGLYFDAVGDEPRALEHVRIAAAIPDVTGYMALVAAVHEAVLEQQR